MQRKRESAKIEAVRVMLLLLSVGFEKLVGCLFSIETLCVATKGNFQIEN